MYLSVTHESVNEQETLYSMKIRKKLFLTAASKGRENLLFHPTLGYLRLKVDIVFSIFYTKTYKIYDSIYYFYYDRSIIRNKFIGRYRSVVTWAVAE